MLVQSISYLPSGLLPACFLHSNGKSCSDSRYSLETVITSQDGESVCCKAGRR